MFDVVLICVQIVAVATGLRTIHRNQEYFSRFRTEHLAQFRMDAVLFIINLATSAASLLDVIARFAWVYLGTGDEVIDEYRVVWMTKSLLLSLVFIAVHISTDKFLQNNTFCEACRRPFFQRGQQPPVG